MKIEDEEVDETALLSEEAREDAAPVAQELTYKSRQKWSAGYGIGIIDSLSFPRRIKWPKSRGEKREFFSRLNDEQSE
jgi:hypothetical protein